MLALLTLSSLNALALLLGCGAEGCRGELPAHIGLATCRRARAPAQIGLATCRRARAARRAGTNQSCARRSASRRGAARERRRAQV